MATTSSSITRHRGGLASGRCRIGGAPAPASASASASAPAPAPAPARLPTTQQTLSGPLTPTGWGRAQQEWWHGVLARIDASLDDDLAAMAPEARYDAVRDAWDAQVRDAGCLKSAPRGAGEDGRTANERRYARLLALFSGRAGVGDDFDRAADVGLALVREFSDAPGVAATVA